MQVLRCMPIMLGPHHAQRNCCRFASRIYANKIDIRIEIPTAMKAVL